MTKTENSFKNILLENSNLNGKENRLLGIDLNINKKILTVFSFQKVCFYL